MAKEEFSTGLVKILREMCDRVNANYDEIDFQEPDWYLKHEWTMDEQLDYQLWLEHHRDKDVHKVLNYIGTSKADRQRKASMFVAFYGWKTKTEE